MWTTKCWNQVFFIQKCWGHRQTLRIYTLDFSTVENFSHTRNCWHVKGITHRKDMITPNILFFHLFKQYLYFSIIMRWHKKNNWNLIRRCYYLIFFSPFIEILLFQSKIYAFRSNIFSFEMWTLKEAKWTNLCNR